MTLLNDMHTDWNTKDDDNRPAIAILETSGSGYWSDVVKLVMVTEFEVSYINDDQTFGELRVHFNTNSWRPDRDGLIYTDMSFMQQLQSHLTSLGLCGSDVSYSEQGMQLDNAVSCDVGAKFLASWKALFPNGETSFVG